MDIQNEDITSVLITLSLLFVWYMTLVLFNHPLLSLGLLWTGMVVLSLAYYMVYQKKKRDMKIFKMRFIVSVIPIYSALAVYVYFILYGNGVTGVFRLMPIGIIGSMLLLNASVVYYYTGKNQS